ncbi:hypothetical protein C8Q80DRAFT_276872 [Daedaleopsis nitida]|nr:hypothetical protein C8Q80DRAFT_276872 [Daedaleopsis nitida]
MSQPTTPGAVSIVAVSSCTIAVLLLTSAAIAIQMHRARSAAAAAEEAEQWREYLSCPHRRRELAAEFFGLDTGTGDWPPPEHPSPSPRPSPSPSRAIDTSNEYRHSHYYHRSRSATVQDERGVVMHYVPVVEQTVVRARHSGLRFVAAEEPDPLAVPTISVQPPSDDEGEATPRPPTPRHFPEILSPNDPLLYT